MLTALSNIPLRLLLTCSAILLLQVSPVEAQPRPTLTQLQQQVDMLTQLVGALVQRVDILEGRGTTELPACITTEGNDVVFNGCNVHIRDGSGDTEGPTNGLGNLIIGYNEWVDRGLGDQPKDTKCYS